MSVTHATPVSPPNGAAAPEAVVRFLSGVRARIATVVVGQDVVVERILIALLTSGHLLLEGVPGLAKTLLVSCLAKSIHLQFARIQFTIDLLPSDILGSEVLDQRTNEFRVNKGPVFTNLLLADEINRAAPKVQSALLEAMQERSVTLLGVTRPLPDPFFVLATQNPIELEGTYPLPEAQLDRFLFKLVVEPADADALDRIISTRRRGEPPAPAWSMSAAQLQSVFSAMDRIFLPRPVARFIARLVAATHSNAAEATPLVKTYVAFGASPRAAIAIAEAARAAALLAGRPTVGFSDVRAVAPPVLNHRLILNYKARLDTIDAFAVIRELLNKLDEAGLNLPRDLTVAEVNRE